MKKVVLVILLLAAAKMNNAQNVGIDVSKPGKKLSVNGSIVVDYANKNPGNLDSASLLFGMNSASVGLNSNRNPFQTDYLGLNMWTNGQKRLTILQNGNIGINTSDPQYSLSVIGSLYTENTGYFNSNMRVNQRVGIGGSWNGSYRLIVREGNSFFENNVFIGANPVGSERLFVQSAGNGHNAARFAGGDVVMEQGLDVLHNLSVGNNITGGNNLHVAGNAFIGGATDLNYRMRIYGNARVDDNFRVGGKFATGGIVDDNYQLRVYGNARIDDNFRVESKMAIGGNVDDNYKLRVYGGNSRFGGNVEVTGTLNTAGLDITNLTIGGKGSVRSNGVSPLKIHFFEVYVETDFYDAGQLVIYYVNLPDFDDDADLRLSISHFDPKLPIGANERLVTPTFTEFDATENRCVLVLRSLTNTDFILAGTYYVMAVMKDN